MNEIEIDSSSGIALQNEVLFWLFVIEWRKWMRRSYVLCWWRDRWSKYHTYRWGKVSYDPLRRSTRRERGLYSTWYYNRKKRKRRNEHSCISSRLNGYVFLACFQLNGWLIVWLTDWLTDLLIHWLIDRLVDWLTDWLTGQTLIDRKSSRRLVGTCM